VSAQYPPPPPPPHPPGTYGTPYPEHAGPAYAYAPQTWQRPPGPAPGVLYAGFWVRLLAYVIDYIIVGIPLVGIAAPFIAPSIGSLRCTTTNAGYTSVSCPGAVAFHNAILVVASISLVVSGVYFTILWSRWGQTLGQKVLGLRVVDAATGGKISTGRAIGRYVGFLVSGWVIYIGLIWAAFDPRKQGWHDKMASTFVVRRG